MATARLFIPIGTQSYGPLPGGADITEAFGSNEAEKISIAANGNVLVDGSFVRGNDCLTILSNSANYLVQGTAAGLIFTGKAGTEAEGAIIRIPAFAAGGGVKLTFSDVEVDIVTTDGETFTLVGPDSNQTVTGTSTGLTIGDDTGGGGGTPGDTIPLTVATDNLTGTADDDTFEAFVASNQNGEQTNQLQSGDRLDGAGGYNTLDAEVQDASALNGAPKAEVVLRTTRVDHLKINAEQANSASDDDAVELDAERAYGVQKITSSFSDASLIVYNMNTMGDGGPTDPINGLDNGRPTASIELCMDHTAGENVLFCASDFEVYFDADYLIPGQPENETTIRMQLMDIDNQLTVNHPLETNPFDRLFIFFAGQPDPVTVVIADAKNNLTGVNAYNAIITSINAGLAAAGLDTWSAELGQPFSVIDPDGNPGGIADGFEILLIDSAGSTVTSIDMGASGIIPGNTDYQKQFFVDTETEFDLITSTLCVLKVGQGGDGGDFIVGSMNTGGVERFVVELKGYDAGTGGVNADQDSSLASLTSTNNVLREVILWSESDVTADIVIGNSVTDGKVPNISGEYGNVTQEESVAYDDAYCGKLYPDGNPCDLTTNRNNALRDVQLFDATALTAASDVTLWAHLSAAFTGKYLDLMDDDVDAKADNVVARYLFGGGDDVLNMNISKNNFAFQGAATREDFAFYTHTDGGNDLVQIQIGDGYFGDSYEMRGATDDLIAELGAFFGDSNHWYTNHLINQNLAIVTAGGNDKVETWGSTAAYIELGAGDDVAFTDNSGGGYGRQGPDISGRGGDFNCCRATWVFNAQSSEKFGVADVNDLLSFGRASIANVANVSLYIQYQDFLVTWEIGDSNGSVNGITLTDLLINQTIKDAINNHPVLQDFLEAKDGPSGTLLVLSKIDGEHLATDFSLSIGQSRDATGALIARTPAQSAASALNKLYGELTAAQLQGLGFDASGQPISGPVGTGSRWDSEFAYDGHKELTGVDSVNVNNNRVYAGPGNDEVALSSNGTSIEHYIIKKDELFGIDHVLNFTAAIADGVIDVPPERQELCFELTGPTTTQPMTLTISVPQIGGGTNIVTVDIPDGSDLDDINIAVSEALEGTSAGVGTVEATINPVTDCVEIVWPDNYDVPGEIEVAFSPDYFTEVQYVDVTGDQAGPAFVSITVPGIDTFTIAIADGVTLTDTQIAAQLAAQINAHPLLVATAGDIAQGDGFDIITIQSIAGFNIGEAFGTVASTAVNVNLTNTAPDDDNYVEFTPNVDYAVTVLNQGFPIINPALGYDIFDVSDILGRPGPESGMFINTQQVNGAEYAAVDTLVDSGLNGVILIDTLDGTGEFAYSGSPTTELARLQQMVSAADTGAPATGQVGADRSVIVTVRNVPGDVDGQIGNFYQLDDPTGAGNATVKYLGTVYLGGYDFENVDLPNTFKDPIGDWDAMTIANFTYQTPEQLMATYNNGILGNIVAP